MKRKLLLSIPMLFALILLFSVKGFGQLEQIHYFNFNDNTPPSNTNWAQPIEATIGSGVLTYTFTEAYSFGGTTVNGNPGEVNGGSFVPRGGAEVVNNGKHFVLSIPTTGYENIVLTYATQRTATGFTTQTVEYSINGIDWIEIAVIDDIPSSFGLRTVDFIEIVEANENDDFAVRFILDGATSAPGNNRFDNISVSGLPAGMVAAPIFIPNGGTFFSPLDVIIDTATEGATIFYSFTSDEGPWEEYEIPLTVDETTTLWAYATADDLDDSNVASAEFIFPDVVDVNDIAELRDQEQDGTIYRLFNEVVLTFQQNFRNNKFIEDGTAGIMIDDAPAGNFNPGVITTEYAIYDGITGIVGTLNEHENMLQFVPVADPGAATSAGNVVDPLVITMDDFVNNFMDYQARLVKIENVLFDVADGEDFANGQVYEFTDGELIGEFRTTFFGVDYIGDQIPVEAISIIGLPNSRDEGDFLTARNWDDFEDYEEEIPDYITLLKYADLTENKPVWFAESGGYSTRGLAAYDGKLYFASATDWAAGSAAPVVHVFDMETEEKTGELNVEGIVGDAGNGFRNLNDLEFSEDGVLFGANIGAPFNESHFFKLWQFSLDPEVPPTKVLHFDSPERLGRRLGDIITIVGRVDDGSLKLYAADTQAGADGNVFVWEMDSVDEDGIVSFSEHYQISSEELKRAAFTAIAPIPEGDFYFHGNGGDGQLAKFDENGENKTVISTGYAWRSGGIKYLGKNGNDEYIAFNSHFETKVIVYKLIDGDASNAVKVFETENQGLFAGGSQGGGAGKLVFMPADNSKDGNNVIIAFSDYKHGFAAFETQNLDLEFPVYLPPAEPESYTVNFVVQDEVSQPITNATVTLGSITNPEGEYLFENIAAGTYNYDVTADGYLPFNGSVEVTGNVTLTVTLTEVTATYSVTFTVEDEEGNPITDAIITLGSTTNELGDYVFSNLIPGSYPYTVTAPGYFTETGNVEVLDEDITEIVLMIGAPYLTLFEFSGANDNLPGWFGSQLARGIATHGDNLYVANRNASAGQQVQVHDRITGNLTGYLNTNGMAGGTFIINDVETSEDGVVFAGNLAINSPAVFKIYTLDEEENADPIIELPLDGTSRLGDKFSVVGSVNDGSAVIYAADASVQRVYKWTMIPSSGKNGFEFIDTPVVIATAAPNGSNASVAALPNGDFYITGGGVHIYKLNADGTLIGMVPGGIVATGSSAIKYLGKDGEDEILAVFLYGAGNEKLRLLRMPGGDPTAAVIMFDTPTLGVENSAGNGSVTFEQAADGKNADLYFLSATNGIAAYTTLIFDIEFPVYPPAEIEEPDDHIFIAAEENVTVGPDVTECFFAQATITVAGEGFDFIVEDGGAVTLVAGHSITMLPGTKVMSGGYLHAYIGEDNPCLRPFAREELNATADLITDTEVINETDGSIFFKMYPNPTYDQITIEMGNLTDQSNVRVEILNLMGAVVLSQDLPAHDQYTFSLGDQKPGLYIVRVIQGNQVAVERLIKR